MRTASLIQTHVKTLRLNLNAPMPSQLREGASKVLHDRLCSYREGGVKIVLYKG